MDIQRLAEKFQHTKVDIRDVGMREGLQSQPGLVLPTEAKRELFEGLAQANIHEINAVAFVNGKKMPHMADAEALLRAIAPLAQDVDVSGLVLSRSGLDRAVAMKKEGLLDTIFLVFSPVVATLVANGLKPDLSGRVEEIRMFADEAASHGLKVGVFCSEAFGSPTSGWVDPRLVIEHAHNFDEMPGVSEMIISDSSGQADPLQVARMFDALSRHLPIDKRICFHTHDSRGTGLANICAALSSPFTHFVLDASFGGLGGDFPFVPDAFGNVATEDLCEMLNGMEFDLDVDVPKVVAIARRYAGMSGRTLMSRVSGCAHSMDWKKRHRRQNLASLAAA